MDVIAPSSPPKNSDWRDGIKLLENWGLKVRLPEGSLNPSSFHANNDKARYRFLKQAFENSSSKAVWCLRGGYGAQKLMAHFNIEPARKKLFIGFSDATAIHLRLSQWNWPSLHGPCLSDLPRLTKKDSENLKQILFGETKQLVFKNLKVFNKSKIDVLRGSLMGGNLTLIQTSLGCNWFPSFKNRFVLLEDIGESAYRLDRALHQLLFSGTLKGAKALLLGSFQPGKSAHIHKVLKSFQISSKIPLVMGLCAGHLKSQQSLPFKTPCELRVLENKRAHFTIAAL